MNRFYRKPKPETMKKNREVYSEVFKDEMKWLKDNLETLTKSKNKFLTDMYSDRRLAISKSTNKRNRLRYLVNVFTRIRFLSQKNKLDLKTKLNKSTKENYKPWFSYQHQALNEIDNIIFGHWAAINGVTNHNRIKGIDLGCVWGGSLAAINLYDNSIITVNSEK